MSTARILIAGTHSGVGKTTVATGLMAALRARGLRVQGFKVGPDFIDPTFHQAATHRPSRNLDGWMLSRETNLALVSRAAHEADAVVIEGVMGLFDGKEATSLVGTTAEMAIWLEAAVVLVLDASAMAGSAAPLVHGFDTFTPDLRLAAVVLNRIASPRHYDLLREAISARCRPEVIGYVPRNTSLSLPERHLGLHLASEALSQEKLHLLADTIESHLNLDRLLELGSREHLHAISTPLPYSRLPHVRIGVARDAAFCFYYQDNLDLLRRLGAELVEFSPMTDPSLPSGLDGLYFGGGYPELHAEALSANTTMRTAVAQLAAAQAPIYAECGGFMYLTEGIVDTDSRFWPLVGIFPTQARLQKRLVKLGYIEVEGREATGWLLPGQTARGHEFRYSAIDPIREDIARVYKPPAEGYRIGSTMGSYVHLHFLSSPGFAERFIMHCDRWRSPDRKSQMERSQFKASS